MPPDPEQQRRSKEDPEIKALLADPSLNQVLQQISQNPQKANELLSDPAIKDKFDTLVAAGMIRLGFPVCWEKRRIGNTKRARSQVYELGAVCHLGKHRLHHRHRYGHLY